MKLVMLACTSLNQRGGAKLYVAALIALVALGVFYFAPDMELGMQREPEPEPALAAVPLPDTYAEKKERMVENSAGGRLNDTGVDWCADNITNRLDCPQPDYPGQDGELGRDALALMGVLEKKGSGASGFDFTKLDEQGNELPEYAEQWSCIRDNHTGLTWEVKVDDPEHLRHKDHSYTWYNPDPTTNGGNPGSNEGGSCVGSDCTSHGYVLAVNESRLCGATDWRMPSRLELLSIVNSSRNTPIIDTDYFPHTSLVWYWTSTPYANSDDGAWYVLFRNGYVCWDHKGYDASLRLVRGSL